MELLVGETLAARLKRLGRLDPPSALPLLRDLAAGLDAVHEAGIVHRDLKSDNVFLVRGPGGVERAVVMDFGLARAVPLVPIGQSSRRALVGTTDYMAPEQVEGRRATRASDIYALGVVVFEMITGCLPFSGDTPMAAAVARLYRPPPRPSELRPELGNGWDRVIGRCLAVDPVLRFAHARDVVAALQQSATDRPRLIRRSPLLAMAVGAAIALVVAGAARSARAPGAPEPRSIVEASPGAAQPTRAAASAAGVLPSPTERPGEPAARTALQGGSVPRPSPRGRRARGVVGAARVAAAEIGDDDLIDPY